LSRPLELPELREQATDRATLQSFCRDLIRQELGGGLEEEILQALTTLVYSVPASAAAVVTLATGGVGHDAVIWAGTLLSTPLLERFVDLLGENIRTIVTRRWSETRGASLARGMERELFSGLLGSLDDRVAQLRRAAEELNAARMMLVQTGT
jgi:hypothetical protein